MGKLGWLLEKGDYKILIIFISCQSAQSGGPRDVRIFPRHIGNKMQLKINWGIIYQTVLCHIRGEDSGGKMVWGPYWGEKQPPTPIQRMVCCSVPGNPSAGKKNNNHQKEIKGLPVCALGGISRKATEQG